MGSHLGDSFIVHWIGRGNSSNNTYNVMVGILILLFGAITEIGLNSLLRVGDELMKPRNLIIVSMILVVGIGGMVVPLGGRLIGWYWFGWYTGCDT